jgi:hypothetical protein
LNIILNGSIQFIEMLVGRKSIVSNPLFFKGL